MEGQLLHAVLSVRVNWDTYRQLLELAEQRKSQKLGQVIREVVERGLSTYANLEREGERQCDISAR